ncbi:hypothetical protein HMPREF9135_1023 [Segatella baroniae F0067]|uniref:Uncharacterized protein n=1 Tax=Segatella baroniae F0067 TaxID=1115809 RepID=U2P3E0_9BACT|nr:hypothetical protein HMPREF9135_1023 [Segatella baroniae F0067]
MFSINHPLHIPHFTLHIPHLLYVFLGRLRPLCLYPDNKNMSLCLYVKNTQSEKHVFMSLCQKHAILKNMSLCQKHAILKTCPYV